MKYVLGNAARLGIRKSAIRKISGGIVVRALAVFAGLLSSVVLARILGPEGYGAYSFALTIIALLALPVHMGLPTLVVRETARAAALKDWALMRGIWGWSSRIIFFASVTTAVLVIATVHLFPYMLAANRKEALLWGVWMIPFIALAAVREAALRGLNAIFLSGLPDQIIRPVLTTGFILLIGAAMNVKITAAIAMQIGLASSIIAFLVGAWFLFAMRPAELIRNRSQTVHWRAWLEAVVPFSLIVGVQLVRQNTDILMLGMWYSDADVGLYRIALSISTLVVFGLVALNMVAQPYIVAAHTVGDKKRLQTIVGGVATLAFAIAIGVSLIIWIEGDYIISLLYGEAFQPSYLALAILTSGSLIHAFFGMAGGVLALTGHERAYLWVASAAVILNVMGNAILIPPYGIAGAGLATAVSAALGEVLKYFIVSKELGIDTSPIAFVRFLRHR